MIVEISSIVVVIDCREVAEYNFINVFALLVDLMTINGHLYMYDLY